MEVRDSTYRLRIMACIIAAELIALGFVYFWPAAESTNKINREITYNDNVVMMDDALITQQASSPPPPPKPRAPVPVPKDEVIEEQIIVFDDTDISDFTDSLSVSKLAGAGDSDKVASSPQQPPQVIRIVEATMPDAAKQAGIKAEVTVNFLVDKKGKVEEASIAEVLLYKEGRASPKIVQTIDYGIPEATLTAALQWKFKPATHNGQRVKAYSEQLFTFGF